MPLHNGHLYLIEKALEKAELLTVLVCTTRREPINGELRYHWMRECMSNRPRVKVIHVTDEVPSYPHEHPDFAAIWTALLKRYIDAATEVVFTSEEYGNDIASWLSIAHCCVDPERNHVPVSATEVRNNPVKFWEFIPPPVRPHYVQKIVLTGPESTGKTSLCEELAAHFHTVWVREYGREYFLEKNGKLDAGDFFHIAQKQIELENEAALRANKILICDTDPMVTAVWSEIYLREIPEKLLQTSIEQQYSLHLLMDIDIPWVNDGTREFPALRQWHFNRLEQELIHRQRKFERIGGSGSERTQNAIAAIEKHLGIKS
ncbi:MAG: AAA family ATPase [Bacteroidia bacterium]|nr:AAA family ATPase [Bacteroidia bacterium]